MNLTELKTIIKQAVLDPLDHRNIDMDVLYFTDVVSTAENIAVFAWIELAKLLPAGLLYEVKLTETGKNSVYYRGE